ncbi:hypothetical protein MBLNU13_g04479t1 [Cladosporium sp. NU13]
MPEASADAETELAPGKPLDTPRKNKVLGYIQCCEDHDLKWTRVAVARALKVTRQQVEYAIKNPYPRTKKNSELKRNNHRKITPEHLDAIEQYLNTGDFGEDRILNWNEVVTRFNLNVSGAYLHEVMKPRLRSSRIKPFKNTFKKIPAQQHQQQQQQEQQPLPPLPPQQPEQPEQPHQLYTMLQDPPYGYPQGDHQLS